MGLPLGESPWRRWWDLHESLFIDFRTAVDANQVTTGDDGPRSLRPAEELIRERIVPALLHELEDDPGTERAVATLLALARIGEVPGSPSISHLLVDHLDHDNRTVAENACLGLGILGERSSALVLAELLHDSKRGRQLVGRTTVPRRTRAYAAYGLGLCAERSGMLDVGNYVEFELTRALQRDDAAVDLHVACTIALGKVPTGVDRSKLGRTAFDRLLELYTDRDGHDFVRAHAATSLATRVAAGEARREELQAAFLETLSRRGRTPIAVRQSTLMAMGIVGDADADPIDAELREALRRASDTGDRTARGFALLSLAEVASRAGTGAGGSLAGAQSVEAFLTAKLAGEKSLTRPWAALALGLLGRGLSEHGASLTQESQDLLAKRLDRERSAEVVGALGLGVGLAEAPGDVEELFDQAEDDSYAALAIGFLGDEAAIPRLREQLRAANHQPLRMKRIASALALLGDGSLVPELLTIFELCECELANITLAFTLGHTGDARVVGPLLGLLADKGASERKRSWAAYALGVVADRDALPWTTRYGTTVNYLANPPTLTSEYGGGILDQR